MARPWRNPSEGAVRDVMQVQAKVRTMAIAVA